MFRRYDNRYHITTKLLQDTRRLPALLAKAAGALKDVTVGAASVVTQLITVLAVTFLLVLHGREYAELGLSLVGRRQQRYRRLIIDIKHAAARYTLGNIITSVLGSSACSWAPSSSGSSASCSRSRARRRSRSSSGTGGQQEPLMKGRRAEAHAGPSIRTPEQRVGPG